MVATPVTLGFVPLHVVSLSGVAVQVCNVECTLGSGLGDLPLVVDSIQSHAGVLSAHADLLAVICEGVELAVFADSPNDGCIGVGNLAVNGSNSNACVVEAAVGVVSGQSHVLGCADDDDLIASLDLGAQNEVFTGGSGRCGRINRIIAAAGVRAVRQLVEVDLSLDRAGGLVETEPGGVLSGAAVLETVVVAENITGSSSDNGVAALPGDIADSGSRFEADAVLLCLAVQVASGSLEGVAAVNLLDDNDSTCGSSDLAAADGGVDDVAFGVGLTVEDNSIAAVVPTDDVLAGPVSLIASDLYEGLVAGDIATGVGAALIGSLALDIELEVECAFLDTIVAGAVCGECRLSIVPLQIDIAILALESSVVDEVAILSSVAALDLEGGSVSTGEGDVEEGAAGSEAHCAVTLLEGVGAVSVSLDLPDDGSVAGADDILNGSNSLACNIVAAHIGAESHAAGSVVDNDFVAVLDGRGQTESVALACVGIFVDHNNTAFAGDLSVDAVSLDGGQIVVACVLCEGLDVVGQNHVVFHDIVLDVDSAFEHCEAVAQITESVVVASHVVGSVQVEGFAADLNVLDAVLASGSAGPNTLLVLLDGGGDVGVDLVGNAGNMEEAAAFSSTCVTSAPFQSVEDLLAGDGLQAGNVAEGVDFLAGEVAQFAGDSLVTDAAAVHDSQINFQTFGDVEQVVQSVSSEVAGVGFLLTDDTVTIDIVVQSDLGIADNFAQLGFDLIDPFVLDASDSSVGAGIRGDELGGDALGVDGHLADSVEVLAGLSEQNLVAVLVSDFLAFHSAVGVAVDESVKAGNVGDQFFRGPGLGSGIVAQVAQSDDVVSANSLSSVDGSLNISVQSSAVFAAGDAVDVVTSLILEVSRSRLGEGFGSGDTDHSDLLVASGEDLEGIQYGLTLHAVLLVVEVSGNVVEISDLGDFKSASHAVVKLVVTQSCQVVLGSVHELNDVLALVHGAVSGALDVVASVNKEDAVSNLGGLSLQVSNVVIGQSAVDVGVNVVGVVDDDVALVGQLLAAVAANAVNIAMAQSGDDLSLGLAAADAGVDDLAVFGAGSSLNLLAFVPGVVAFAFSGDFVEDRDDLSELSTGSVALRIQNELAALVLHAADDGLGDSPVESCLGIVGNLSSVSEISQIVLFDFGLFVVAPHHGNQLLAGNQSVGVELALGDAVDNTGLLCPCNTVLVPIIFQVGEGRGSDRGDDGVSQTIQNHSGHSTGKSAIGLECSLGGAVHKHGLVLINVLDVRCKPVGILHVGEGLYVSRKRRRQNADDHNDCQKQSHDLLECVFHDLSSLNSNVRASLPILVLLF